MGLTQKLKPFEVRHNQDEFADEGTTRWGNRDIYPVIKERWTFSGIAFFTYWATAGLCVSSYTLGSSMIGIGLTAGQAVGGVLLATGLSSLLSFFTGQMGRVHRVGFFMNCRSVFGLQGANFMLVFNVFGSMIYFGVQAFYGGQAVVVTLSAMIPQYKNMANTLPESAGITTRDLLGFLIYFVFYVPCIFIPAWRIHKYLYPNFVCIGAVFVGMLAFFLKQNNGPGALLNNLSSAIPIDNTERVFAMLSSVSSIAGAYTGGTVKVSDWTRFGKTYKSSVLSVMLAMPICVTTGALVGVLVTSAAFETYGIVLWNPLVLLMHVQDVQYTAACRAATFFAGLALIQSQIFENITQNGLTSAMELSGVLPRYIDIRRGLFIMCFVGIIIQPWRMLTQAATFMTVLSAFGVFYAPMTGIMIIDLWVVRKQKMIIPDLYREGGIYWYFHGWHWRGYVAWILGSIPSFPGLVATCGGYPIAVGWLRVYSVAYFVGIILGGGIYYGLCLISPPPGLGIQQGMDEGILEGSPSVQSESGVEGGKGGVMEEKAVPV